MTVREAALLIGCSPRHVRTLITRKLLAARFTPTLTGGYYDVHRKSAARYALHGNPDGRGWPRGKPRN